LGNRFTAADVVLGGQIAFLLRKNVLPPEPDLLDYNTRLTLREAYHRASDATWPQIFAPS
jgi:glutathione S-transferase